MVTIFYDAPVAYFPAIPGSQPLKTKKLFRDLYSPNSFKILLFLKTDSYFIIVITFLWHKPGFL
ncbi:hypothetical protein SAMN04487894_104155 [Niabella drilacis]|uniref:Uncharacterized protein n=1 Tax=Niabella drilacis (strain DSM 25811 / CCM 8410 / CCUG 62505 / LMG 26954 / E90) TaxID=1285928 RepID=A0A1G6PTE3_NIADE|nr:hypothetical protein SAMN04487894_104155 [Niabella drilacis]